MLKLEPAALTDVGRKRSNNQDYLGDLIFKSGRKYGPEKLNERGHLFAVADGMGGYAGGEVASELAITTLFERFYNGTTSGDMGTDLSEAIRAANLKVHTEASGSGRPQMGTTLTSVLVKGNKAIFGNVGDSRTYLIRQGLAIRVTHDHSLVQDQIDAGVLTPEQAERSAIKNFITRAIGHRDEVESDLFEREIQPGDVLLLCSDGLHGLVKEQEMGTIVATATSMQEASKDLVNLANERGGHDNISVMLIKVEDIGEPLPDILQGREPIYNTNRSLYNQTTEPLGAVTAASATTVSQADVDTVPRVYGDVTPMAAPAAYSQPTAPLPSAAETAPAKASGGGGRGLIIGILVVLIVVILAVLAYVLFFNSPAAPVPTAAPATAQPGATVGAQPAATPTITTAPTTAAQTTVATLPTATPPAAGSTSGTAPAPTTSSAAGGFTGTVTPTTTSRDTRATTPEDQSNSGSADTPKTPAGTATQCSPAKGELSCWSVTNLAQVSQIRVLLKTTSASKPSLSLQLPTQLQNVVSIPFTPSTNGYDLSLTSSKITLNSMSGEYALVIAETVASQSPRIVVEQNNNTQIWASTGTTVRQEGTTLVIEANA